MTEPKIVIGTRGSKLALWQSNHIKELLVDKFDVEVVLKRIKTQGDKILDVPLAKVGGKGLFVKELEVALTNGDIDMAVHSMKDVPTVLPSGLHIAAMTKRVDPRDVLISKTKAILMELPQNTRVGTSSLRRQSQIRNVRPDFLIVDVRGNLETRLRKMDEGEFDAIILAAAGVDRMGYTENITERLSPDISLSAVGQGAIGIETRIDDKEVNNMVATLNHQETFDAVSAERSMMRQLEGGCQVPIGALATTNNGTMTLSGIVATIDGKTLLRDRVEGPTSVPRALGLKLAQRLLDKGAGDILKDVRAQVEDQ